MSNVSIVNLRKRFDQELSSNPNLYHPIDIERVRTEEFQVKRFLLEYKENEEKAFRALIAALRWKEEFGIHERNDQYFPKEFWELNGVEIDGVDREGSVIQWGVLRYLRAFKETALLDRQFSAHLLERLDRIAGERKYTIVADCSSSGLSNVDIEMTRFHLSIVAHYPMTCRTVYIVDLPWILTSLIKFILGFISPKFQMLLQFVNRQELTKYIEPRYIPVKLGGQREKLQFPSGTVPLEEISDRLRLSKKFVDYYYNYYKFPRISNEQFSTDLQSN